MMTKRIVWLIFAIVVLVALMFALSRLINAGRIEIILPDGVKTVTISAREYNFTIETEENILKQNLPSGAYFLQVLSEQESTVMPVDVVSFYRATKVDATVLFAEKDREIIAKNPRNCSHNFASSIVSWPCMGSLLGLVFHHPANKDSPGFVTSVKQSLETTGSVLEVSEVIDPGSIIGVYEIDNRIMALVKSSDSIGPGSVLYELLFSDGKFSIEYVDRVEALENILYTVMPGDAKISLVASDYSHAYVGETFDSLERKQLYPPSLNEQVYQSILLGQNTVTSYQTFDKVGGFEAAETGSKIDITNTQGDLLYSAETNTVILKISNCGDRLCVIDENGVFSIYTAELQIEHELTSTKDFMYSKGKLYIITDVGVVELGLDDLRGSYLYRSELLPAEFSGDGKNLLFSVNHSKGSYAVQLLTTDKVRDTYSIDNAVGVLLNSELVSSVSVFKNIIYISPELGEREYDVDEEAFVHSEEQLAGARAEIDSLVTKLDLVKNNFTIFTPGL